MSYKGIDVSFYQGNIDWAKVAQSGIEFAIIRASYGSDGVDPQFKNNINNIAETSIARGAYHFCYAISTQEALNEANHFLDTIAPYQFNYPVALDLEYEPLLSLGREKLSDIALTFCDTVEKAGYYTMIYANLNWIVNYLDMNKLNRFDIWLAQWGNSPTYSGNYGIWQYSSKGNVNGINENVDLNISYRDYPSIIKNKQLNGFNNTPSTPPSVPTNTFNYTVVSGDNLWNIAKKFLGDGSRYPEIMSLNGLTSTRIYPGQILKIPSSSTPSSKTYIVVSGDNLWNIAKKFLGDGSRYTEIMSLNGLTSTVIYPGQVLKIPN